jgi:hypothetical protein
MGDMTSASDRPRLLLLMGGLLYPDPEFKEFRVGIARRAASHFADTTSLQRGI